MRTLIVLALGAAVGAIATVLFFTLDTSFETDHREGAGGGNVRLSLDEDALESLMRRELTKLPAFAQVVNIDVTVREDGLVDVQVGAGVAGIGTTGTISLDPEVVDGKLEVAVAKASLGSLAAPREVAAIIEAQLQQRLDSLAGGSGYKLTAITTTDHRLTLEIEL